MVRELSRNAELRQKTGLCVCDGEKLLADTVAFNLALVRSHGTTELAIIKRDGHLLVEVVKSIFDNDREAILRVVNLVRAVPEMSGINHTD